MPETLIHNPRQKRVLAALPVNGAAVLLGAWRVTFWGALAMAITAGVGALFGALA
jgi:hypothetical protein